MLTVAGELLVGMSMGGQRLPMEIQGYPPIPSIMPRQNMFLMVGRLKLGLKYSLVYGKADPCKIW